LNDGFTEIHPTISSSTSTIFAQASQLSWAKTGAGFGSNTILLGHSQGGLVARALSQNTPVHAIVSIGTPHLGAPIAGKLNSITLKAGWIGFSAFVIRQALESVRGEFYDPMWDEVNNLPPDVVNAVDNGWMLGFAAAMIAYFNHYAGVALAELSGESGTIGGLNFNYQVERVVSRRAIVGQLDWGYDGGPLRLIMSAADATIAGQQITWDGVELAFYGSSFLMNSDLYESSHMMDLSLAAGLMIDVGLEVARFRTWWHYDVVGDESCNDGIVPCANQVMPGAQFVAPILATHLEETNSLASQSAMLAQLNSVRP
jgi:hypothetical protein